MFDVAFTTGGVILVVLVWLSVLHTTLVPTRSSRMAAWTARVCVLTGSVTARTLPPKYRKRVMDLCMPVSLFVMAAGWLAGLALGFAMLVEVFGGIGQSFRVNGVVIVLTVAAAASAMLVAAAFAAYLIRFMEAFGRREEMINRSAPQVQRATDADALVASYLRAGSRDSLDSYFAEWADWLADVHESHIRYPGLVYTRSPGDVSWTEAAMVAMDAAALVESVAPRWAPVHTRALLNVGSCCLQGLARSVGIVLPTLLVSLQGREERAFGDTIQLAIDSGLPAERDIDQAWMAFQEIRVRYAPYAVLIGTRVPGP